MGNQNSKLKKNKDKLILKLYKLFSRNSMFYNKTKFCFIKLIESVQLKEIEKNMLNNYELMDKIEETMDNVISVEDYIQLKKLWNPKKEIIKENFIKLISIFSFKDINR